MKNNHKLKNKGVTLVEVMIALTILLLVFLGLIQASILSIESNLRNALRDEATRIGGESMVRLKALDFNDALLNDTGGSFPMAFATDPTRQFRNTAIPFAITKNIDNIGSDDKRVTVRVSYTPPKGAVVTYDFTSVFKRRKL